MFFRPADDSPREAYPLVGRNAILKERKNDHFVDVGFGHGEEFSKCVFAITKVGLLCAFNDQRQLVKWIDLKVGIFDKKCAYFVITSGI